MDIRSQPPGTGKTKTIIECIKLLKGHFLVPYPIMLCTYTNVAVDHLVEGLAGVALRPLRIGHGGRVKPSLAEHSLDAKLAAHPSAGALQTLREQAAEMVRRQRELLEEIRELKKKDTRTLEPRIQAMQSGLVAMQRQLEVLRAHAYGMYLRMVRDVVVVADVVSAPLSTT